MDDELFDLRCMCGVTVPSTRLKFSDLSELIQNMCLHFVIYTAKSELDQLRDGLTTLGLLHIMESNYMQFLPSFLACHQEELTADKLIGLFKIDVWSPKGSNDREDEEAVIVNWENYVRTTKGKFSIFVNELLI